jgi:hypothetical protein
VRENVRQLGVRYPVALDNDFVTWQSWHNQYWPAKYLIDKRGHVRYFHFGEGGYGKTSRRSELLGADAPPATGLPTRARTGSSRRRPTSATRGSTATPASRS